MNKIQYLKYRRDIRDNGLRYILTQVNQDIGRKLCLIDLHANNVDLLAWRVSWINNPDTTKAKIIKLTSPIL